ncbi:ATP binding, partial [Coemansia sp. RSA 475]
GNDEIVRRALSLLRKPEPNPQAEKEIVEAAMRCEDSRAAGSTRAQFVQEQQRRGDSVGDTVRSLFAKYNMGPAGVRFQWIRGKLIGRGSFGHVYVAINAGTGEVIAVKQIRLPTELRAASARGGAKLADAVQMMDTEVELLRELDHENIVQLLGFEVASGLMSMFIEYVPGGTVQSLVQQHGPLPETVVHSFVAQVSSGLAYLHERGILHRDIKGANILVDHMGTCKISDFGISRKIDRSSVDDRDKRRILGTVPFMAPEVARDSVYSEAADIWALGCVVVQMWSGRPPWDDLQEPQVFFKLGRGEAPPIPDDLTEAGLEYCKVCFAHDPNERWQASQLAQLRFAQVHGDYEYPYRS